MDIHVKDLQSKVKKDVMIMCQIKSLVGKGASIDEIRNLQNLLEYEKIGSSIDNNMSSILQKCDCSTSVIVPRIKKIIEKLRTDDFQISLFLSQFPCKSKKVIKKVNSIIIPKPWVVPNIDLLSSDSKKAFSLIKNEKIPVVLSIKKVVDLTKMPHLLVAGQTGSGKSVFLNAFITTILLKMNPETCKLVLIDPKRVEFSLFKRIPHLWRPVATELDKISDVLDDLEKEMDQRYEKLELLEVRNIESYNKQSSTKLPLLVVVIDELADLMMVSGHGVETQITRLAQLARAVGIHIIMATQRPVVEIMTGLIKANMPSRIAFKVASKQDSRVILDTNGAEELKGNGDMIFMQGGSTERHQGIYVSEEEIKNIIPK